MPSILRSLTLATQAPIDILDVTARVQQSIRETGVMDGLLTVLSRHTTAYVCINENEAMLRRDMVAFLQAWVPADRDYLHNRETVDGRPNAHAHLMGLALSPSQTVPIHDGDLLLGQWQSILFVELDGPRPERELSLHILRGA